MSLLLALLPAGLTTLTFQGRVDPNKPCQGQKVRNEVHLFFNRRYADQFAVDTPLICQTPTPTGTAITATATPTGFEPGT